MAVIDVVNQKGEKVSQVDLSDQIFSVPVKGSVLHEVVKMQLANRRAGTHAVKHRSDVTGSTRKLFRQKGTGRARRGDIKSPVLRGGGSIFGPDPRSYTYKVPKKVRRLALKMALSSKLIENKLVVLDGFFLEEVKTKRFVEVQKALNLGKALFLTDQPNEHLDRSSRNIQGVKVLETEGINVYDILAHDSLVIIQSAVSAIEGRLS
ncbi:MAG: 50S ribosomal protein L4 [Desulfobacterales bacterium]|nr:50S ribosomal protein L4 [Desulfobacterales bacterium]